MDVTTLALAVDSTQVNTAATALDKMAASGTGAEAAASRLARASTASGAALNATLAPAANKSALAFKSLAEAEAALGPAAAKQLEAAGAFNGITTNATSATAAVKALGDQAQRTAMTWREFLSQRMGPVMKDFSAQGLPHTEAHTAAIRQIANEWKVYKAAGIDAQTAITAQTNAATAAATAMGNAIQRATTQTAVGRAGGIATLTADSNRAKAAIVDLSRATTSLGATGFVSIDKMTTSLGAAAAKANEAAQEVNRLDTAAARLGALSTATTSFGASVGPSSSLRDAITRRGQEEVSRQQSDPRFQSLLGGAAAANALAAAAGKADGQMGALAKSSKLAAFQQQQLAFQINDFVVQVASGSSPVIALVQQGSQLSGTFGGIGNAIKAVMGLFNPFRVALLVTGAAAGVFAIALARAESSARAFNTIQAQLAGTGRSNLFSVEELRQFTQELTKLPGVSRETALQTITELSRVHEIGGVVFKDLAVLAVDYAKATGTEMPIAAKNLARAVADPERGIRQLDDALGTISSTTILTVDRLVKLGDVAGARKVMIDALRNAVKGLADDAMTPLQRSIDGLGNAWERAMVAMDKSQGLRNLNVILGKAIEHVTWLIDHSEQLAKIGRIALGIASLGGSEVARALLNSAGQEGGATGSWRPEAGQGAAGALANAPEGDANIKRSMEAAKAFKSEAGQIAGLVLQRQGFQASLKESIRLYGKESEQAKIFRDAITGVNERIASAASKKNQEPQQVADVILQRKNKETQTVLEQERSEFAFQQRFLQDVYQTGQLSLKDFYEQKRKIIEQGVSVELAALDKREADVRAHLKTTEKLSPKDLSKQEQDRAELRDIEIKRAEITLAGSREIISVNGQETLSYTQLNEQVLQYRANLLQLQGDELGAARIRAQITEHQTAVLAKHSQGSGTALSADEVAEGKRQVEIQSRLEQAKRSVSVVNEILIQEEERIALAQRTGAITELDALRRVGDARSKTVTALEEIVRKMEEVAAANPKNLQLQLDTSRARLELDRLKADLDPLKEKFDNLFKDAGASAFEKLLSGDKKGALQSFFTDVSSEINRTVARNASELVFGKDGPLGGLGGIFADAFGGKNRNKPVLDTSSVTASLSSMQTAGLDPATAALGRFQSALDTASSSVGQRGFGAPGDTGVPGVVNGPTVGGGSSFGVVDESVRYSGEQATMGLFKAARSGEALAGSNETAAATVLQMANAAARGGGALSQLPQFVSMIFQALSTGRSSGGGIGGTLLNLVGSFITGGTSGFQAAFFQTSLGSSGFGTGLAYGNQDYGQFFAKGGYTGDKDQKQVAGVVHGKEFVFSAPAVKAIGRGALDAIHESAKQGSNLMGLAIDRVAGNREIGGSVSPNRLYRVNERSPEVLRVRGQHYLMSKEPGEVKSLSASAPIQQAPIIVNVTPPEGASRSSAEQWGATAGKHINRSLRRTGSR